MLHLIKSAREYWYVNVRKDPDMVWAPPNLALPAPSLPGTKWLINERDEIAFRRDPEVRTLYISGTDFYRVWLPYTYYHIARGGARYWKICQIAMSAKPRVYGKISLACLPNMYAWAPCYQGGTPGTNKGGDTTLHIVAGEFDRYWSGRINQDGGMLRMHPVALKLAGKMTDAYTVQDRALKAWEKLSREEVLALPWPDNYEMWRSVTSRRPDREGGPVAVKLCACGCGMVLGDGGDVF